MKLKPKNRYLTKRIVISASKKALLKASKETMQIMGHNVIVQDGWVVKKHADGTIEKIQKITSSVSGNAARPLQLD